MKKYIQPTTIEREVILTAYNYTNSKGHSCATPQAKMMDREAEEKLRNEEWGNLW